MKPFYQRSFLRLLDFSSAEIQQLLALSLELKQAKKSGHEQQYLTGKNIALIFEKDST
ncbi:ornithine carbamoyltransferase subunit F, partial [Escherichia coli]